MKDSLDEIITQFDSATNKWELPRINSAARKRLLLEYDLYLADIRRLYEENRDNPIKLLEMEDTIEPPRQWAQRMQEKINTTYYRNLERLAGIIWGEESE